MLFIYYFKEKFLNKSAKDAYLAFIVLYLMATYLPRVACKMFYYDRQKRHEKRFPRRNPSRGIFKYIKKFFCFFLIILQLDLVYYTLSCNILDHDYYRKEMYTRAISISRILQILFIINVMTL